jgi:hypothetical protein
MNNPYDFHSWSKHYRKEALREAQARHLVEQARRSCAPGSVQDRLSLTWACVLLVLRLVMLSE